MDKIQEDILRRRMHGLYISRGCGDIARLSHELLGLHCWFHRNVAFSALIRGASLAGWKTALTKTWLYRGTLHGALLEDLPDLLALHPGSVNLDWLGITKKQSHIITEKVIRLMEDGIYSRAEMRKIFADEYAPELIERLFSPWGGIFVCLARMGKVAFRDMTSRDFDLIEAPPYKTREEVLPEIFRRFIKTYGPASFADAAWFLGLWKDEKKLLSQLDLEDYSHIMIKNTAYYYLESQDDMRDIPELTLLSGFDPLIVSYAEREAVLPPEYKKTVILSSGICLPTIAVNGRVAGLWNIKKNTPVVEFFTKQPKKIEDGAYDMVDMICRRTAGII